MARILVIRGGAIGDFILTLPALRLLRDSFPKAHLEIVGYKQIIALAEGRFYAQATRSIEYAPFAGFFSHSAGLSEELCAYFAGFQQVISFLYDPDGIFEANVRKAGVKNFLPAYVRVDDSDHAARQLAHPLEKLALYLEDPAARVFPSAEDRLAAAEHCRQLTGPIIALHPGSGGAHKNWPLESWAELGRKFTLLPSSPHLLLVGGEADIPRVEELTHRWRDLTFRTAFNLSLPRLAAVLERTALFLGHDSGISHLAAAVCQPCHLLFGPTDPDVWAPANPQVKVQRAPNNDLTQLSVDAVWEQATASLREK